MELNEKVVYGLERVAEVFKSLLWDKAKRFGLSPMQIQILLFVKDHNIDLANVSHLSKEFNVTKPTISDAVRVLVKKELLVKDHSPSDNRRYNLLLTTKGQDLVSDLGNYVKSLERSMEKLETGQKEQLLSILSKLLLQLNQEGILQVQRMCYTCKFYRGDRSADHYCMFLESTLANNEIRLDCPEHEIKDQP